MTDVYVRFNYVRLQSETKHFKTYIPPETSGVYIEIRNAVWGRRGGGGGAAGRGRKVRRVKESRFRKSSPRKCKKGVDRWYAGSTGTYNGGVSASSGTSEDQRARETKGLVRETGTRYRSPRWIGARARDHESIAAIR